MKTHRWITWKDAIVAVVFLAIGILGTSYMPSFGSTAHRPTIHDIHEFDNKYRYINPLLACSSDQNIDDGQAKELEKQMETSIAAHENAGDVSTVSVYFRDLNGGPWVGINFDKEFSPGSLLKVPLAMSIYKKSEDDPNFLARQLDYTGKETNDDQYYAAAPLPAGKYSVADLVKQMLINSNNNTANVLANAVGTDEFLATYNHLGVSVPSAGQDYTTNAHDYVSFFRVLYNATYVDDDDSETLLQIMSQSVFKDGLVAGVPPGTVVSHKFGERGFSNSETLQLHDCGIVYAPGNPYLICVMTQGADYKTMAKTIADISSLAYNYVE